MSNPVEDNFVTRFILGSAVLFAMMVSGGVVSSGFLSVGIPYGDWFGFAIGVIIVFAVFTVLYRRYDASYETE